MIFKDYYEINLVANNEIIDLRPTDYSFIQQDSIHSLYNWAFLNLKDITGLIQESLFTVKGLKVSIGYGIKDYHTNTCEYIIDHDKITEPSQKGILSGELEINLINSWINDQSITSKAYQNSISNIIRQLASKRKFSASNIDSSECDDIWYQLYITDAKFINDILLPNAYSSKTNNSPYYCYIDSNNAFNFKNLKNMIGNNPSANLHYVAEGLEGNYSKDSIMRIRRWRPEFDKLHKFNHRYLFSISLNNSTENLSEDYINSYPSSSQGEVPIVGNRSLVTDYLNLGYEKTETGQKQSITGRIISSSKDDMFIDRFIITIPFNPKLLAGKTVDLKLYTVDPSQTGSGAGSIQKVSTTFSGKYLVEQSKHVWNGEKREGFTTLIIGRKFSNLSSSYILKSSFI